MPQLRIRFHNTPELICQVHDTDLGNRYFSLLQQQYQEDPKPIFRDPQKYTLEYFRYLAQRAKTELGWNWVYDNYDLELTIQLHKDIEQYLAQGYENIPEQYDELLNELHFCLHQIESGSKRNNWLQVEWFNNNGFPITADEYPGKVEIVFGDLRLQNPYVGHHPLYLYEQNDTINVEQTCRFHDYVKPGFNIIVDPIPRTPLEFPGYPDWFHTNAPDFVEKHGWDYIMKFTGHPIIGSVLNLNDLKTVVGYPILEFEYIKF